MDMLGNAKEDHNHKDTKQTVIDGAGDKAAMPHV